MPTERDPSDDRTHIDTDALVRARRINVVGPTGSGKTTFGRRLAQIKDVPFVEMDQLFWEPGWQEPPDATFFPKVAATVAKDAWVLDGNYSRTRSIKWARTDVIVFLDLPFRFTFLRVFLRAIARMTSRREIWPGTGNRETFRKTFLSHDSILLWSLITRGTNRRRYDDPAYLADYPHVRLIRLRSRAEVSSCLDAVRHDAPSSR